ncbi:TraB/GumN family protein [Phenylobacterium koreense]|uniref:Uncharacterized protein YbaP (TraB family) n=1 Tax=Phenylobacterium koreense TaxID=266125 RepID=A0ABV2EK72_9CAUL
MKSVKPALGFPALGVAVLMMALAVSPAPAQVPLTPAQQQDPNDPDGTLVEELVVTARLPGPAWWRVSDGDTTVYVLGAPSVMPKSFGWDRSVLERRLKDANEVILPFNSVKIGVLRAPTTLLRAAQIKGGPVEDDLPEPLRSRFVRAREAAGQPAKRYGYKNELAAAITLVGDYRSKVRLTASDPAKTIGWIAQSMKLKIHKKSYDIGPLLGAAVKTSKSAQRACLQEALDEVEAGPASVRRAAEAWAQGDVRGALNVERGYDRCMVAAPGAVKIDAKMKADQAAAIEQALQKPGHAVAVVQLRPLLSQGGVLDRLRAKGYEIGTPGGDEAD